MQNNTILGGFGPPIYCILFKNQLFIKINTNMKNLFSFLKETIIIFAYVIIGFLIICLTIGLGGYLMTTGILLYTILGFLWICLSIAILISLILHTNK